MNGAILMVLIFVLIVSIAVGLMWYNRKYNKKIDIGTAIIVGVISIWLIKRFNIKTISGEKITIENKTFDKGQVYGGLIFGIGWAITGACPGPLFAQIGTGATVIIVTLLSAIAGTWVYGLLREKLPH